MDINALRPSDCMAVTGHRSDKLGGYSEHATEVLGKFAYNQMLQYDTDLSVIIGCALGWDTAIGEAAIQQGHKLICCVPFEGFELKWPREAQMRLRKMLNAASCVHVVSSSDKVRVLGYARCLNLRNEFMVDRCGSVLALHSGANGGTANAVDYAQRQNINVKNVWCSWLKYRDMYSQDAGSGVNWSGRK